MLSAPPAAPELAALRRTLGWLALLYAAFVVYGSLVPFAAQPLPLAEAWRRFTDPAQLLRLEALSRIDIAVNIALTVPLALLARGWLHRPGPGGGGIGAGVGMGAAGIGADGTGTVRWAGLRVWLGCALLSVAVEFAQVFFPGRTHAWSDVLAQWLGAALGLGLHRWRGDALRAWALGWWRLQRGAPLAAWVLRGWLLALVVAALVPLDLSISPVELYRKWRDGRVHLLPFSDLPAGTGEAAWQLAADLLLWLPVGVLWRLQGASARQALWRGALAAAVIELAQLAVLSRVSSSTDVLVGALGVAAGAALAGRWAGQGRDAPAHPGAGRPPGATAAISAGVWRLAWLGWALLVPLAYWFPYGFDWADPGLPARAQAALTRLPFEALYASGEQRAVTELLRKLLVFAPGGLLWALWQAAAGRRGAAGGRWLLLAALLAVGVELGQLGLPGKLADATDALLGVVGGALGWVLGRRLAAPGRSAAPGPFGTARPGAATPAVARSATVSTRPSATPAAAARATTPVLARPPGPVPAGLTDAALLLGLALAVWLLARLPGVPYNLRELLPAGLAGLGAAAALAAVLWWWWALPLALAQRWAWRPGAAMRLLPLLPVLGLPAGLALLAGAPRESLHDLLGSPVWPGVPAALELLLRHAALHGALALAATGAVWLVARLAIGRPMGLLVPWAAAVLLWAVPIHALVVAWAATDNLTELMRGGGGVLSSLCLGAGLLALLAGASALAAVLAGAPRRPAVLLLVPAGLAIGSLLLWLGSEPVVLKYDRAFSAAQFLLSAGRDRYAAAPELLLRWLGLLAALLAGVALLQAPRWRALLAAAAAHPAGPRPPPPPVRH